MGEGTGTGSSSGMTTVPGESTAPYYSVVWEWLNEHGRWRPYNAAVCQHIERLLHTGTGTGRDRGRGNARGALVLGSLEPRLSPYIIDLQSMQQFRQDTGNRGIGRG
ncbi:hypothetical protein chiPu_0027125, partial [Chiloscyllium punctatum]|nr:hypothetical protein [Chiloscyllium punctatum]